MPDPISGIHHITGICGPAQQNLDFYTGLLGLRFVKRTVNFDDAGTYHLYYGDEVGRPGSILTFFPWPDAMPGRPGAGMMEATAFSVPEGALEFWIGRLADEALNFEGPLDRFGSSVLRLYDPDGLPLELTAHPDAEDHPAWLESPIPSYAQIRGFYGATLCVRDPEPTARLLTETFGYELVQEDEHRTRYRAPREAAAAVLDLLQTDQRSRLGRGTIHHIAFRASSSEEQLSWREELLEIGFDVTEVKDRQYFRSIYFREPNGILFEIATDGPGFTADEEAASLGRDLKLPPWLEPRRPSIEKRLPELRLSSTSSTS